MLTSKSPDEAAVRAVLDTSVSFLEDALAQVEPLSVEAQQAEYQRLVFRKFKSSCPVLFSPTRIYVSRHALKQVKTRKTDFLPQFVEDDDEEEEAGAMAAEGAGTVAAGGGGGGSLRRSLRRRRSSSSSMQASFTRNLQDIVKQKHKKAGSDIKAYLFSDALLISRKRFGKRVCKAFIPLAGLAVIDLDGRLDIFGLKFPGKDGAPVCHVYKAGSPAAKDDFLVCLRREMALSVHLKNEVIEEVVRQSVA